MSFTNQENCCILPHVTTFLKEEHKMKKAAAIITLILASKAQAVHIDDLKFNCTGKYKVTSVETEYHGPCGKFGGISTTHKCPSNRSNLPPTTHTLTVTAEVVSINSPSCKLLNDHYGFDLKKGSVYKLTYGAHSESEAFKIEFENKDKIKNFSSKQIFSYQDKEGELPFFPLLHQESVSLFQQNKKPDVEALYGTPKELTDAQKLKLTKDIMWKVSSGKNLQEFGPHNNTKFVKLMLTLVPKEEVAQKEYAQSLLNLLGNLSEKESSVHSRDLITFVGKAVHNLFEKIDGTKWKTKLEVYQDNPVLFDDSVLPWTFSSKELPIFSKEEMEDFLAHSLEQVEILSQVKNVHAAFVLKLQYQNAAQGIQLHSKVKEAPNKYFELSEESLDLIDQIITFNKKQ